LKDTTFSEDVKINQSNLDWHFEMQPMLYLKWAERHAQAVFEMDKAKEQLDLVKAEVDAEIREDPEKFGLSKVTEAAVSNSILQHPSVLKANGTLIEARKNVNIMTAAKEAMAHKKKSLEMLAQLWLGQYPPSQPKDGGYQNVRADRDRKKMQSNLNDRINRRRKEKNNG